MTNNIKEADVIICQNYKHLKLIFLKYFRSKKYLIWTLEPRFNTHFIPDIKVLFGLFKCHVMNVYTDDVFISNLTFHAGIINKRLDYLTSDFKLKNKKIIALMSYYKGIDTPKLIRCGKNIDLIRLRSQIVIEGFNSNIIDVYGKGWPDGISKEDSRDGDWVKRKKELMEYYYFNLCFENTIAKNYMTEKIWNSIENYCLPIYYGLDTNAYKIFPKDSFIDYSNFKSPEELFDYVLNLSSLEYVERMNKCIDIYNSISSRNNTFVWNKRKEALDKIVNKVNLIVNKTL